MVILLFLTLFIPLILIPAERYSKALEQPLRKWRENSLLYRGESLLRWIESYGVNSYGFNLGEALPARGVYKEFGDHIHVLWRNVQKRGGEMSVGLRAIRMSLRQDLKRTKKEKSILSGAKAQVFVMVVIIWAFMIAFRFIGGLDLSQTFFMIIGLWQGIGVFLFLILLKRYRSQVFGPLETLLSQLLEMHLIYFRGGLADAYLEDHDLKGKDGQLFIKMQQTLENWRRQGQGQLSQVDDLFEDFFFLCEDKEERFLGKLKMSSFVWSLFFVLPPLFSVGVFGLNEVTKL